ncbi:MAG: 4Fe-4S dicluster domain-containing protein [Spirochaetes bacterium]|nr:4Fe-4S dicluster domain-containing protein [Spirochaetota bacterium]
MHICIFWGFILLLLMHALDELVTKKIFSDYFSTLDPYQFLRNLFGVMVLAGVCMAVYRRIRHRGPMLETRRADRFAIALLSVIIITGFAMESAKMISESVFNRMMNDFFAGESAGDEEALKAYWSEEYGTSFRTRHYTVNPTLLARGRAVNEQSCASCHSPARSAFVSRPLAKLMRPSAARLEEAGADNILYYIHVLACLLGLAMLPFTKFFHVISDPIAILVSSITDKKNTGRFAALPRRAMELDACTSCGTCSRHCSVEPVYRMMGNRHILPMEKLRDVRALSAKKEVPEDIRSISEGAFICTSCFRCTEVCPAGINLQDQWNASRELLSEKGHPSPHEWIKDFRASEWSDLMLKHESSWKEIDTIKGKYYNLTDDSDVFAPCIQCQTCTNVCPVVAARTDPEEAVDITPQKIMNLLRLGLNNLAMGSRMVWDCTTCYQCQEHCPQGIRVTEIIYELKNRAYDHFKNIDRTLRQADVHEDGEKSRQTEERK